MHDKSELELQSQRLKESLLEEIKACESAPHIDGLALLAKKLSLAIAYIQRLEDGLNRIAECHYKYTGKWSPESIARMALGRTNEHQV